MSKSSRCIDISHMSSVGDYCIGLILAVGPSNTLLGEDS